jgi:RNA methyltransferase, TrmH family
VPGVSDLLSNPRAERVRAVARLSERPARARAGVFLAEGPQAVREALAACADPRSAGRPAPVRELWATPAAAQRHPDLLEGARDAGVPVRTCTEEVLAAVADTRTPQGLVAVCALVGTDLARALDPAGAPPPALVAVLAQVRDPGNAGTVLRTADAAGAGAVVLTADSVDVHNPKCVRATAGSLFHLDVVEGVGLAAAAAQLREAGLAVLAADGADEPGTADLDDLLDAAEAGTGPLAGPTAWVFGNEAHGLSAHELAVADLVVQVPLHGRAESLNLATAAAVCLYASARAQRRCATPGAGGARDRSGAVHTVAVSDRPGNRHPRGGAA